jgi:hypothetical protein
MRCPFARVLGDIAQSFHSRVMWGGWPTTCQLLGLVGPSFRSEGVRGLEGEEMVDLLLAGRHLLGVASGFECSVVILSLSLLASFSGSPALLF